MADTITVTVNCNWVYDKAYAKGDTVTIPKTVYESTVAQFPGMFTEKKADAVKP